jgi:chromosome partitioning protein
MTQAKTPTITVFCAKGGVGKTTLNLNLAGAFAAQGLRVCVVDADPQASSLAFARLAARAERSVPFTIAAAKSPGFDLFLIDEDKNPPDFITGDLVVIPSILDGQNQLAVRRTLGMLAEQGKKSLIVPNRVRTDRAEQRAYLAKLGDVPFIRERALYSSAYASGLTVFDPAFKAPHAEKARSEFDAIADAAGQLVGLSSPSSLAIAS